MDIFQELHFSINIFTLLYILQFLICFQLFSLTNSLSSGQHCLLISISTHRKLTFPTWRLNLALLARIDLRDAFKKLRVHFFIVKQEILQVEFSIKLVPSWKFIMKEHQERIRCVCIKINARVKVNLSQKETCSLQKT